MKAIFKSAGIDVYGICRFEDTLPLIRCAASRKLPTNPKSVIICAAPYHLPLSEDRNISRFAAVRDYHDVLAEIFAPVTTALENKYGGHFVFFTDNSPIHEVRASALAGVGFIGDNGLIITEKYGSYVFIATLVTDIILPYNKPLEKECLHCGKCKSSCPAKVIGNLKKTKKEHCLSAILQKKGILNADEEKLIADYGSVWGCDACQDCCPHNAQAEYTKLEAFRSSVCEKITADYALVASDRAFCWRGSAVIMRNLKICGY